MKTTNFADIHTDHKMNKCMYSFHGALDMVEKKAGV